MVNADADYQFSGGWVGAQASANRQRLMTTRNVATSILFSGLRPLS